MLIYLSCPYLLGRDSINKLALNLMREGHYLVLPCRYHYKLIEWTSESDYQVLRRCDAIYLSHGWTSDQACQRELRHATNLKLRIFIEGHFEPA